VKRRREEEEQEEGGEEQEEEGGIECIHAEQHNTPTYATQTQHAHDFELRRNVKFNLKYPDLRNTKNYVAVKYLFTYKKIQKCCVNPRVDF
jgi:hypothetical protein